MQIQAFIEDRSPAWPLTNRLLRSPKRMFAELLLRRIHFFGSPGVSELILTSHCSAARGLLATDHVILNHGQVTWTTPELAPPSPNYHTTPMGRRFSSRQI
ncbi:hypothetical protein TNCV_4599421 [Trichonephila clavipes]|nr:hypothetical protein TNCV_4599421 [Trichonephila clavipes]